MSGLNERQELAVALLASGVRNKDTAEQLGIARVTLAAWLQQPAFKHAIAIERARAIDAIQGRLLAVADRAIQTLLAIMDDPTCPAPARVSAARTILGRVLDSRPALPEPVAPPQQDEETELWNLIRSTRAAKQPTDTPRLTA